MFTAVKQYFSVRYSAYRSLRKHGFSEQNQQNTSSHEMWMLAAMSLQGSGMAAPCPLVAAGCSSLLRMGSMQHWHLADACARIWMCEHCEGRCGCTAREAAGDGGVTGGDGHERMAPAAESSGLWLAASALQEGGKGEVTAEEGEEEGNSGNEETINSPVKWNGKMHEWYYFIEVATFVVVQNIHT